MEHFETSDGVRIAYRTWPAAAPASAPERPPVVLHHGFAASAAANWEAPGIVDALVTAGRRVVALDARGHGDSDKPHDPARYGEARMAQDLSELLDVLGAEQVDLAGYSMGAIVAVIAATTEPRLRRVVIGGVGAAVAELGGVDTRQLDNHALAAGLRAEDPATITSPAARAFRTFADRMGGDRIALAAQAEAAHRAPIAFDRITAETLLLVGTEDDLARRPEVLAEALGAQLVLVPGDHLTAVAAPEAARAIVDFLGR